jgi:hypothetical protein
MCARMVHVAIESRRKDGSFVLPLFALPLTKWAVTSSKRSQGEVRQQPNAERYCAQMKLQERSSRCTCQSDEPLPVCCLPPRAENAIAPDCSLRRISVGFSAHRSAGPWQPAIPSTLG